MDIGGILILATTSSVTIFFNAILSPLILGEKFSLYPDGVTLLLVCTGGTIAGL